MEDSAGSTIEARAGDSPLAESIVRSSWPGFYLEHRVVPPRESPRCVLLQPVAGLALNEEPVVWNWRANGRDNRTEFHPGSINFFPAGDIPAQHWDQPLKSLDIFFHPHFLARVAEDSFNGREPEFRFEPNTTDPSIEMLFRVLFDELKAECPTGPLFGESIGTALAMLLIRRFAITALKKPRYTRALNDRVLDRVIDYIDSHLGDNLSLATIADIAHVSPWYFSKLFKISMGQSVHQYVLSERLKRARWLLTNRTLPPLEIALACGFSSQSHFATAFRNETGLTPRQFRLQGNARSSVESNDSRVTHSTTPFSP